MRLSEYLIESISSKKTGKYASSMEGRFAAGFQSPNFLVQALEEIGVPKLDYDEACKRQKTPCYGVLDKLRGGTEIVVNMGSIRERWDYCFDQLGKCFILYHFDLQRNPKGRLGSKTTYRTGDPAEIQTQTDAVFNQLLEIYG